MILRRSAITLIEIVVTLAVSSIVMMAAYSFFNVSVRSWDFSSSRMDAAQSSVYIIDTLEKLIKENYLNCRRWCFGAETYGSAAIQDAVILEIRPAVAFRDGLVLSFNSDDQVDAHSRYFGFFKSSSSEVFLWDSRFENDKRIETSSSLGRNITELALSYFDKNFDTRELWNTGNQWYNSREIQWIGIRVKSVVGDESSESNRLISLWR